ncbi:MAG: metalloprotease PmbA [Sphingobium sp.]|nr:metalloprotease PmbA [Sphingobium sp.]
MNEVMIIPAQDATIGQEREKLEAICLSGLEWAHKSGAEEAEIVLSHGKGTEAGVRDGQPENLTRSQTNNMAVTVYAAGRKGTASVHSLSVDTIRQTVEKAIAVARFTQPDDFGGLAEPEQRQIADADLPDLGLWRPWAVSPAMMFDIACEAEAAGLATDERIRRCAQASITSTAKQVVRVNSNGFVGYHAMTRHQLSASFIAENSSGQQKDGEYDVTCDPALLASPAALGAKAAALALGRLDARSLTTRTCPVLFTPEMAARFWNDVLDVLSGPALYSGRSFLAGRLGEKLTPDFVTITEKPHIWQGTGSRHYDDDGLLRQDAPIISEGVLRRYVLDSYAARRLGMQSTHNAGGISNMVVAGEGPESMAEMIAGLNRGLVVTSIMGHGFDGASGDYSVGVTGMWVEHGEIVHAVEGVTIAAQVPDMLAGIVAISKDHDRRGKIRTGALLLDKMTVAGI